MALKTQFSGVKTGVVLARAGVSSSSTRMAKAVGVSTQRSAPTLKSAPRPPPLQAGGLVRAAALVAAPRTAPSGVSTYEGKSGTGVSSSKRGAVIGTDRFSPQASRGGGFAGRKVSTGDGLSGPVNAKGAPALKTGKPLGAFEGRVDFEKNVDRLGVGDKYTVEAGGSGTIGVATGAVSKSVEVEASAASGKGGAPKFYTVSQSTEVGAGVEVKPKGSTPIGDAGLGVKADTTRSFRTEYQVNTKAGAVKVAELLNKSGPLSSPEKTYLAQFKSAESTTRALSAGVDAELGLGVAAQGKAQETRHIEYQDGKPKTATVERSFGVDLEAGYDVSSETTSSGPLAGLTGARQVKISTSAPVGEGFNVAAFTDGTGISRSPLPNPGATTTVEVSGSVGAGVLGNGGSLSYKTSVSGTAAQMELLGKRLLRGEPRAVVDVLNTDTARVELSTSRTTGLAVAPDVGTPLGGGSASYKTIREDNETVGTYEGKLADLPRYLAEQGAEALTDPNGAVRRFLDAQDELGRSVAGSGLLLKNPKLFSQH